MDDQFVPFGLDHHKHCLFGVVYVYTNPIALIRSGSSSSGIWIAMIIIKVKSNQ